MSILLELFSAPGCRQCARALESLEAILADWPDTDIVWRQVNILEELDYTVACGVLATPAIAIDGKLVFTALPSAQKLRQTLQQHLRASQD
ncbi:MAG: thioredoxin family protein [gamma proteobacterium symbiont of Bathyaustriella thionipta]|nr:thioredoxin family protein [gamma proteobacterium symbiont of Bathyaustriella thionipta]